MSTPIAPKMKDVAARCGVSESTVSHVINGTKSVSPKTRAKVQSVLLEMNFHRDAHARCLAQGHSNFLGLIISDIENPFYPGLIKAFESAAQSKGFEVLLCTTNYALDQTDSAFRKMIENKSPGVAVMTSRIDPKMGKYLSDHGVASVFLDSGKPGPLKSDIRIDYRKGVCGAVRYLHRLGHHRFALIAGPQDRASHMAYREAVVGALDELGLKARIIEGTNEAEGAAAAVRQLLTDQSFPTAILCSNDVTAMSAIRTLFQCGLRVPEDVSVVGADDIPFAALTQPPLTTVRIPREQLGNVAVEMLQEFFRDKTSKGRMAVLDTDLVIRESAGIAPKKLSARAKR